MNLAEFAQRTHIWMRFRRAMMTLGMPLFMLAVIPTTITLAASLPFAVNFFSAILPLFGVAAYAAYKRFGVIGFLSVAGVFGLGLLYKLLNSISGAGPILSPSTTGKIDRIEGGGGTMVVLIAMLLLFGAAMYFTGRYVGSGTGIEGRGIITVIVVFVLIGLTLGSWG